MGNAMPSGNLLLRSQWTELAQIEATKLNPPSKPWRSSLRMPKTQCSGPKNHVTLRAVFNAMRSTEVFGLRSELGLRVGAGQFVAFLAGSGDAAATIQLPYGVRLIPLTQRFHQLDGGLDGIVGANYGADHGDAGGAGVLQIRHAGGGDASQREDRKRRGGAGRGQALRTGGCRPVSLRDRLEDRAEDGEVGTQ